MIQFQNLREVKLLKPLLDALIAAGGTPYLVGGFIRDQFLERESKDIDLEVADLPADQLEEVLTDFGDVKRVGKAFGVFKLTIWKLRHDLGDIDVSLPRRERKVAEGHTGFEVEFDPFMDFADASSRRDFTINAMGWNAKTNELHDPHGGRDDLANGVLRAVTEHFKEDPLRVLRGMRFAAQCNLSKFDLATIAMCRDLKSEFDTISVERIWTEWHGWAMKSVTPSLGMEFLRKTGWITFFPEIQALMGVPQDPTWHPEGDVFIHTCMCLDAMRVILDREEITGESRAKFMLTILGHDFGKPKTTEFNRRKKKFTAYGHCPKGAGPMQAFLKRIDAPQSYEPFCVPLIIEHLAYINNPTPKNVAKLADRLGNHATISDLLIVIEADQSGRLPLPQFVLPENAVKLREVASQERVVTQRPRALIQGRHLQELGLTPGPTFGPIIKALFQLQLDQQFSTVEDGLAFVAQVQEQIEKEGTL